MFCNQFNTLEEAIQNVGNETCEKCDELIYKNGLMTCNKMKSNVEIGGDKNDNK